MYTVPPGITAISFDIWKTLINANRDFTWPRLELVFGHVGILDYGREAITASYRKAEKLMNRQAEITGYDTDMSHRIEYVLDDLGITDKVVPDAETIIELQKRIGVIRVLPEYLPPLTEPDLIETLWSLKAAGYKLGTLSNTGMGDCHTVLPVLAHYGLDRLMDVKLFSCEDGRAKPNPGYFRRMAEEFGVEPHKVLHVGDNANADCRAVEAGLQSVLYAPDGEPEGNQYPFITSMKELL